MERSVRIGVIGGGLVAQVEHIPNLMLLRPKFDLVGISDPSAIVRGALAARYGVGVFATAEELLAQRLEAVLIAAPDPWHADFCVAALEAGSHVFCEKPLCYGPGDLARIAAAQSRAGRILQVGYMKRLDPSYVAALELVRGKAERLRYISVEVSDPDAWPFVAHHQVVAASDVPGELRAATSERQFRQVTEALGLAPDPIVLRGFAGAYCSSLVHDVNAVHGLLDAMGVPDGELIGASLFAGGRGGQAVVRLLQGQALWSMAHFEVAELADYRERIALYFDDEIVELNFPSPYLNHQPTRLVSHRSQSLRLDTREIRPGFAEPFQIELEAFWAAIVEGAAPVNSIDQAGRDQKLLIEMGRLAAGAPRRPEP